MGNVVSRLEAPPRGMAAKRLVEDWNAKQRLGGPVIVTLDDGSTLTTKSASEAWLLGGHTAVVLLEGISGAYALHRVEARV